MPPVSKIDLFAAIRRDARDGMSGRALAGKYKVSRRTVKAALASAWPRPPKPLPPRASELDPFKPVIDEILRADLDAPRKQRHTVRRIYDRLALRQHTAGCRAGESFAAAIQELHRFHGLHPEFGGSALPLPHPNGRDL